MSGTFDDRSLYDKMMYGGLGYGLFCIPRELPKYFVMIIFPPLAVFIEEKNSGFKNVGRIIINFILTSFFYFPGLLHALNVIRCGALTDKPGCKATDGNPRGISNIV